MSDELKQAVQDLLDHVGPERLARNYNLTSMEIPGDMLRRLAQAVESPYDVARKTAERDWLVIRPDEMPNMLMNMFSQDPRFGPEHPLVKVALFRLREALARVNNSLGGYFEP